MMIAMKPRIRLDSWEPEYTAPAERLLQERAERQAQPLAADGPWRAKSEAREWSGPLIFVDGRFRSEAPLYLNEARALLVSMAVGAVALWPQQAHFLPKSFAVARYLLAPAGSWPLPHFTAAQDLRYQLVEAAGEYEDLRAAAMQLRQALEMKVGDELRGLYPDALILHDGPLHRISQAESLGRLGYAKTHHRAYLSEEHARLLSELAPAERTPVFTFLRGERRFYSWYLRLPLQPERPYAAAATLLRVETAAPQDEALRLADVSLGVFPRLASRPFRDPRAPQNLVPVAALERELGRLLGSPKLLRRRLLQYISEEAV